MKISADSGIQLTNHDLYIKTIRAAQNLKNLGFKKDDVFSIIAKNSHHVAPVVFASFCLGCPVNTLSTEFGKAEIKHLLGTTNPKLIFCDTNVYDLVSHCLEELENNASFYTFGGVFNGSNRVEDLFLETNNELEFT